MDKVNKDFVEDLQQHVIEWDLNKDKLLGKKVQFVEDDNMLSFKIADFASPPT